MNKIHLLLGSNLSDPIHQLALARGNIDSVIGKVIKASSIYQTAAWGKRDQPDFFNQVLIIETGKAAVQVLHDIFSIEMIMGRIRTEKNDPRIIDIDILFYQDLVIHQKDLDIPHPALQKRRFVLVPLDEISPGFLHPVLKKTVHQLLRDCTDHLEVKKI